MLHLKKITLSSVMVFLGLSLFAQQPLDKLSPVYEEILEPNTETPDYIDYDIKPSDRVLAFEYKVAVDHDNISWVEKRLKDSDPQALPTQRENWLKDISTLLSLGEQNSFRFKDAWVDDLGHEHFKYDQLQQSIKVYDGEIILHAKEGAVYMHNGRLAKNEHLPLLKRDYLNENEIKDIIKADLPRFKEAWQSQLPVNRKEIKQWEGELVWFEHAETYGLAYHYEVYETMMQRWAYVVDAYTGEVLEKWSLQCGLKPNLDGTGSCSHSSCSHGHTKEKVGESTVLDGPAVANARDLFGITRMINTYEFSGSYVLIDASRPMFDLQNSDLPSQPVGAIWTVDMKNTTDSYGQIISNNNSFSNNPEGVSAHYNAGLSYEYFRANHNRNGLSGDGQTIQSFVNVVDQDGNSMGQAFYSQFGLFYGNGDSSFFPLGRGLDVAGHELSHGVVVNSANLEYRNESGAMNESFADVFGAMIDRDDWLIGEDVVRTSAYPSGALRSLQDPHNGRPAGAFNTGWQPRHVNEKFNGPEDNGGVHINSGIPNYAFYCIANNIGKSLAEVIYYRALTNYLVRSSGFNELRYAVERATMDISNQSTLNVVRNAFDKVGITNGTPSDEPDDVAINVGDEFLLVSDLEQSNLFLFDLTTGSLVYNPLSTEDHISKPSATDSGRSIIFVGADGHIHLIQLDYNQSPPGVNERILTNTPEWRNCAISKDASKIVAVDQSGSNSLWVFDLNGGTQKEFTLFNPTYTQGVNTGDVDFADAMEFDFTSNFVMYDASSTISSVLSNESINYWDIGFIQVWDPARGAFADGDIQKLFSDLPDDVSVGNPTFSKNSPYIIAFDVIALNQNGNVDNAILGMNIETNQQALIAENGGLGYPHYSRTDQLVIYDRISSNGSDLGQILMEDDKISGVGNSIDEFVGLAKWGVWLTAGNRDLPSSTEEKDFSAISISPNPASEFIFLDATKMTQPGRVLISDINGKELSTQKVMGSSTIKINVKDLVPGIYLCKYEMEGSSEVIKFIKE